MREVATLVEMLERRAQATPSAPAFLWEREQPSYAELWERVRRMAAHLRRLGIDRGERVVLVLPNGPEFFYGFYGAIVLGAIAVPVFPGSGPERVLARADLDDEILLAWRNRPDNAPHHRRIVQEVLAEPLTRSMRACAQA